MRNNQNKEKSTTPNAMRKQRCRENLTAGYIRSLITKDGRLKAADIPPALVESVRLVLASKRLLKAYDEKDAEKIKKINDVMTAYDSKGELSCSKGV